MSDDQRAEFPAPPPPNEEDSPPLTARERAEVRDMLEADRRVKWFWRGTRAIAIWVAAVGGSLMLLWDGLVRVVKHIVGS